MIILIIINEYKAYCKNIVFIPYLKTGINNKLLCFYTQAEFAMFEESGHNLQVEEPPALFALIREFLRK
jgi:pimeloyl-ACP methyl ester carboxylesterase